MPSIDLTATDPRQRADALDQLADAEEAHGRAGSAHLARLVSDTERLMVDDSHEPTNPDDPAWDDEFWWSLAGCRDREQRGQILRRIHDEWAVQRFGVDESEILLTLADVEQGRILLVPPGQYPLSIHARTGHAVDDEDDDSEDLPSAGEEVPRRRGEAARMLIQAAGGVTAVAVFGGMAAVVAVVPIWELKVAAALVLIIMPMIWVARNAKEL